MPRMTRGTCSSEDAKSFKRPATMPGSRVALSTASAMSSGSCRWRLNKLNIFAVRSFRYHTHIEQLSGMKDKAPAIGIMGGSGLYQMEELRDATERKIDTPFGAPSDALIG